MESLAKALRSRSSIAKEIAQARTRAERGAVVTIGKEPDFDTNRNIEKFSDYQFELRAKKYQIAHKTATTEIPIPTLSKDMIQYFPESGKKVSLYQAILIRDDAKALKQFFESLISIPTESYGYNRPQVNEVIEKERKFDFNSIVTKIDEIQEVIDTVDATIQFYDNTINL